jgi:hypothetical protein
VVNDVAIGEQSVPVCCLQFQSLEGKPRTCGKLEAQPTTCDTYIMSAFCETCSYVTALFVIGGAGATAA